jgi:hypothetical protein
MSNIRFLDNVSVSSYQSSQNVGSNFPRVVFSGESRTVPTNTNSYAYEVYNLGIINIASGIGVAIGGQTIYSDALLRIENLLVNEGIINLAGILELGDLTN